MVKRFFSRITVLYLTAKVERKEKTYPCPYSERKEKQNFTGYGDK